MPGTVLETGVGEENGTDVVLGHLTEEVGIQPVKSRQQEQDYLL